MARLSLSDLDNENLPRLTIGWCKQCAHKIGQHPLHPGWRHFCPGYGYLLTVNCMGYAGSTNTVLDLGAVRSGLWKCDCLVAEPDPMRPYQMKWVIA